jgi:hypothetical protein
MECRLLAHHVNYGAAALQPLSERSGLGDACSIVGRLDVHVAEYRLRRKRIAFCAVAKQLMLLRVRSAAKARASSFFEPPAAGGFVQRPRVG